MRVAGPGLLAVCMSVPALAAGRQERRLQDAEPLSRYLDHDEIVSAILGGTTGLAGCVRGGPAELSLRFGLSVDPSGRATAVWLDGGEVGETIGECLVAVLSTTTFAPHDEDPVVVSGSLAVQGGVLLSPFAFIVEQRPLDVLFFYLPPDLEPSLRRAAATELGHRPATDSPGAAGG